jgi:CO/xanthine dehydrogenase Mo-binding subunit
MKNLLRDGSLTAMGTPLPGGVSLVEVTEQCALAAGWVETEQGWSRLTAHESRVSKSALSTNQRFKAEGSANPQSAIRRGIGIAVGYKNIGFSFGYQENCWAKVELQGKAEIKEVVVAIGSAEVGQGTHTAISQMAAEALDLPLERIKLVAADTATSPGSSGSVSASRMTFMAGNAIRGAAKVALEKWRNDERPATAEYTYLAPRTTPFDPQTGYGVPNFAYGYVAQAVEVEVDIETGHVNVLRVICADDVGRAVNPQQIEGQIEGGVAQAVGWVTCENLIVEGGEVLTPHLSTYLIPTIADVPERIDSIIVEHPNPEGPWGARGMGEMPFLPLAPALIAAVHDALSTSDAAGVWFSELPLTPERVLVGLGRVQPGRFCL